MGCAAAAATIGAAFATVGASVAGAVGLGAASLGGIGAGALIGGGLEGAVVGAGLGAVEAGVTGGNVLKGALTGGLTGGVTGGFAPALSGLTEGAISPAVAGGILGAGTGALGSAITGSNPLTGALEGGAGGFLGQSLFGNGTPADAYDIAGNPVASTTYSPTGAPQAPQQYDIAGNPVASTDTNPVVADAAQVAQGDTNASTTSGNTGASPAAKSAGGISNTALALGALSALGSVFNKPQAAPYGNTPGPAQVAANTGPYFNTPLNTNVPGRIPVNPFSTTLPSATTPGGYGVYGGPEKTYFTGNSLSNYGFAKGGALGREREFRNGSGNHRVRGPGTETSDSIPARLSQNEYVLDAEDVRLIGGGSVERGSKLLDRARPALKRGKGALARLGERAA